MERLENNCQNVLLNTCQNTCSNECDCNELKKRIIKLEKELAAIKIVVSKLSGNYTLCHDSNYNCDF